MSLSTFKNKTVLITGASAGVGAACARYFAHAGANLALARVRHSISKVMDNGHSSMREILFYHC